MIAHIVTLDDRTTIGAIHTLLGVGDGIVDLASGDSIGGLKGDCPHLWYQGQARGSWLSRSSFPDPGPNVPPPQSVSTPWTR